MADFMFEEMLPPMPRNQGKGGGDGPVSSVIYNILGMPPAFLQGQPSGGLNWGRQQAQGVRPYQLGQGANKGNQGNKNQNQNQGQRGAGQGGPPVCWGCNQPGHTRRNSPTNPWEEQNQGGAPQQGSGGGPMNYQGTQ
ncbi:hypothetical protein COCON_G00233060 [Conger conger]|uniref:Uncharacterized protein n=1 Tax=Conger conger TaxID=82655 RepID=A0A9Q1CVG4_CONCO|nr:hypothetical protein COCON_G00233060 [Conger conger]